MVLDFLPWKRPGGPRRNLGWIRYVTFVLSFTFVAALFAAGVTNMEAIMFRAFIAGNVLYYAVGIGLAYVLRDNRAFCKYICPVTVFLKPMSYFAVFRVECDRKLCTGCGICTQVCPMEVDMRDPSRKRKNGTECILCMECRNHCPRGAIH